MDELIGELYVCFSDDQIDEVKDLLDKHPQLLQEKFNDDPWLVLAASDGKVKQCQLLLDRREDVNEKGRRFLRFGKCNFRRVTSRYEIVSRRSSSLQFSI